MAQQWRGADFRVDAFRVFGKTDEVITMSLDVPCNTAVKFIDIVCLKLIAPLHTANCDVFLFHLNPYDTATLGMTA